MFHVEQRRKLRKPIDEVRTLPYPLNQSGLDEPVSVDELLSLAGLRLEPRFGRTPNTRELYA